MSDLLKMPGIFMHNEEIQLIRELSSEVAEIFNPCNIVHVGIGWGGSCYYSRAGAPNANIYGVDIVGHDDLRGTDEEKRLLNLIVLKGDSRELYKDFWEPIHFLYVDGDHTYPVLAQDIINWGTKVVVGGYIAFHDCKSTHWSPDVNRAIDDTLSPKCWEDLGIAAWSRYFRRK